MTPTSAAHPSASFDRRLTTAVELDGVTFGYDRTRQVLSGITMSIPRGQVEAAIASGMTYRQRMRLVILPQAFKVTIPPLLSQAIVLVKDSALLSLISVSELTRAGQLLASDRFMPAEGFLTIAAFYLLLYYCLKGVAALSARRLGLKPAGGRA